MKEKEMNRVAGRGGKGKQKKYISRRSDWWRTGRENQCSLSPMLVDSS